MGSAVRPLECGNRVKKKNPALVRDGGRFGNWFVGFLLVYGTSKDTRLGFIIELFANKIHRYRILLPLDGGGLDRPDCDYGVH